MRDDSVKYPDCLNDESNTLDAFVFDYFNNAYPDEMQNVIKAWDNIRSKEKKELQGEI